MVAMGIGCHGKQIETHIVLRDNSNLSNIEFKKSQKSILIFLIIECFSWAMNSKIVFLVVQCYQ